MDMPLLRRSTDTELIGLVISLASMVQRLEAKVDMLIIQRADEAPYTGFDQDQHEASNHQAPAG